MNTKEILAAAFVTALFVTICLPPEKLLAAPSVSRSVIGADPSVPGIPTQTVDPSGTRISLTEGNLIESQNAGGITCSTCSTCEASQAASHKTHGIRFIATYNSRDADGSRTQLDTVMGNGWTHSFNIFLFRQAGSMFRFDGQGRVTKYSPGPGNTFIADTGYFETLVGNPDGTFTLTQKDKTTFTFASVSGDPFIAAGPTFHLIRIVDRNNDLVTLTYSGSRLVSVSNTYGRAMRLTYSALGKVASVTDPLGRSTTLTYDATGRKLTTITDSLGKSTLYAYNTFYQLTSKRDKDGRTFAYSYTDSRPTASIDNTGARNFSQSNPNNWAIDLAALANSQLLVYLPSTTTKTDGRGNLWRYEYDSRAYVTRVTAPDGALTQYSYDPGTRMVGGITDPNNNTTRFEYDSQGNRTKVTLAAPFNYVTTFTYEPTFNMMTSMTDPKGRVTAFGYDSQGNRTMETDPLLQTRQWTYDAHGNALTETDKRNNTATYAYDTGGNRNMITAPPPLGYITRMTYDSVGNLKTRTDPNNHTTTFDYDGRNRLITETDPAGKTTQTFYDGQGNRIRVIDRNNHSTLFEYDQRLRLFRTTDALGQATTAGHDDNNNRVAMGDKNGHTTTFEFDVQNRLSRTTDAEGDVTTMTYDLVGNLTSTTDANLHTTTNTYDALNRRSTVTDPIGYLATYEYDMGGSGCGTCGATPGSSLITKQTDGNGKVTYFKYDPLDRLTKIIRKEGDAADVIDASDAVTTHTYDPDNNRLSMIEPNGNTAAYGHDVLNRRTRETNAAGDVTQFTYDGANNLITTTAPNSNVTTNTYDSRDRITQVDDSLGRVASFTYDDVGNVLGQTYGNSKGFAALGTIVTPRTTRHTYDAIDRPTIVTDPLLRTTVTEYDPVGNVLRVTDREGRMTTSVYDDTNRRISSTNALGHTTQYEYDRVGNVLVVTDANGHATQYQYDGNNRLIRETYADPPPNTRTFTYDAVNLLSRTDQKNQTTTYTYNDLYFLLRRTYPSGPPDNFTHDLSDRMLTAERGGWLVTFVHDGANRVTQTTQNGKTISYVHNIPGRTRTVTYPGSRSITEQMDLRDRLATVNDTASSPVAQYVYDLGNRVLARSYRNGITAAYRHNANDWVTSLEHTAGDNVTRIAGFGYDFDKEGNKKFEQKRHDTGHSEAYLYDNIHRLTNYRVGPLPTPPTVVTQTAYNLDPVGNWNSKTTDGVTQVRMHNEVNELTAIDATSLTYDDNGNLQNGGAYTYAYDEEDRLIRVTRNSDAAIVGQYQYDALSRRVRKIANPAGTPAETRYFYDGTRIIEEQDAGGVTQATYTYGNYIDEVLTMDRGGQAYYYHQNSLWSVEAITDVAGAAVERYSYDAYGQPSVYNGSGVPLPANAWGTPHSAIGNPWMFTGRQLDEETGLHFYRARYLDSNRGRFITRDPIGIWGDSLNMGNGYVYVADNPLRWTDPAGRAGYSVAGCPTGTFACCNSGVNFNFGVASFNVGGGAHCNSNSSAGHWYSETCESGGLGATSCSAGAVMAGGRNGTGLELTFSGGSADRRDAGGTRVVTSQPFSFGGFGGGGFNGGGAGGTWLTNSMVAQTSVAGGTSLNCRFSPMSPGCPLHICTEIPTHPLCWEGSGSLGGMFSMTNSTATIGDTSRLSHSRVGLATGTLGGRVNFGRLAASTRPGGSLASQNMHSSPSYIDPCGPWGTPESCEMSLRHPGGTW